MKSLSERRNLIRIGQAGRTPDIGDGVPVPVRSADANGGGTGVPGKQHRDPGICGSPGPRQHARQI